MRTLWTQNALFILHPEKRYLIRRLQAARMPETLTLPSLPRRTTRVRGLAPWQPGHETRGLLEAVGSVLGEYRNFLPLTIRQVFYRLVGVHSYDKTEAAYGQLVETLNRARRAGFIAFNAIRGAATNSRCYATLRHRRPIPCSPSSPNAPTRSPPVLMRRWPETSPSRRVVVCGKLATDPTGNRPPALPQALISDGWHGKPCVMSRKSPIDFD